MRKTALRKLKEAGAPDAALAGLIFVLALIVLAPVLGGQVIARNRVPIIPHPTYVAIAGFVFLVGLFLPLFDERDLKVEISRRISWIKTHLDNSPLEVKKAYEAVCALEGRFQAADPRFRDIDLEALLYRLGKANTSHRRFKKATLDLYSVLRELPPGCVPGEPVELKLERRIQDAKHDFMLAADSAKLIC